MSELPQNDFFSKHQVSFTSILQVSFTSIFKSHSHHYLIWCFNIDCFMLGFHDKMVQERLHLNMIHVTCHDEIFKFQVKYISTWLSLYKTFACLSSIQTFPRPFLPPYLSDSELHPTLPSMSFRMLIHILLILSSALLSVYAAPNHDSIIQRRGTVFHSSMSFYFHASL